MDRFFRGIGNRMRGERDEDAAAADVSEHTDSEEAEAPERTMADNVEEIVEDPSSDDEELAAEGAGSDGDNGESADPDSSADDADASDRVVVTNPDDAAVFIGTDSDSTVVSGGGDDWILVTDGDSSDSISVAGGDEPEPEPEPADPDNGQTGWNPDVVHVGGVADVNLGGRDVTDAVIAPPASDDDQTVHDAVWPGDLARPEVARHADLGAFVNTGDDDDDDDDDEDDDDDDDEDDDDQLRASDDFKVEVPNVELQRDPSLFPPVPEPKAGLLDAARTEMEEPEQATASDLAYLDVWERHVTAANVGLLDAARTEMDTGEAVSSEPAAYTETQGQKGPQLQGQQEISADKGFGVLDPGSSAAPELMDDEVMLGREMGTPLEFIPTGETALFAKGDPAGPVGDPAETDDGSIDPHEMLDVLGVRAETSSDSEPFLSPDVKHQPADLTFEPEPAEPETNLLEENPALIDEQSTANSLTGFGSFELRTDPEPGTGPEAEASTSMQEIVNIVPDSPVDEIDFTPVVEEIPLTEQSELSDDEGAVTSVMPGDNITGVWTDMRPLSVSGDIDVSADDAGEVMSSLPDDDDDPLDGL
jgi:hypothetical protein